MQSLAQVDEASAAERQDGLAGTRIDGLQGVVSALTHFARGAANIASAVRGALSQFAYLEVLK